jgi:hypothetical protein
METMVLFQNLTPQMIASKLITFIDEVNVF